MIQDGTQYLVFLLAPPSPARDLGLPAHNTHSAAETCFLSKSSELCTLVSHMALTELHPTYYPAGKFGIALSPISDALLS